MAGLLEDSRSFQIKGRGHAGKTTFVRVRGPNCENPSSSAEQAAKARYASQIEQFRDHPEVQTLLKSVLADEEDHEVEFTRYLKEIA